MCKLYETNADNQKCFLMKIYMAVKVTMVQSCVVWFEMYVAIVTLLTGYQSLSRIRSFTIG